MKKFEILYKMVLLWIAMPFLCFSQEKSVVEILSQQGELPMGRATIVSKDGKAITANHVLIDNSQLNLGNFKIKDRDGAVRSGARFIKGDIERDIALIQITSWEGMEFVEVGKLEEKDEVVLFDIEWKKHNLKLSLEQSKHYYFDFIATSGESGSGVFSNGKLVGIVSGGWFWIEQDIIGVIQKRRTYPLRVGRIPDDFVK
jgi:hypothetical protein